MAIKTGEIFNSLVFGGVNSADYGIYITGEGVFNAPKRAVNMVAVPGRNGSIAIDQGHWDNIEVTYPAGTFGMDEEEFRTALSNFRNAIASQVGYQRLTDTYHPDEYRMAIYTDGLEVEPTTYNKAGEFELKFNCKPQRWLTAGEVPVTIGEWGATKEASGEIVTIESEGGEAAKSLEVSLEPIQSGSGEPSPSNVRAISGRTEVVTRVAGKNLLPSHAVGTATANGLTTTHYADGSLKINGTATASTDVGVWSSGNVAKGIQGSYKLNGCTNGAASRYQLIARVRNTSASTNRYVPAPNGDAAISTNATEVINNVYINVKSGIVMNNVMFYPMLRLATETDDNYEPYQGATYTTALGRTVYGGTLDVVSGVLTVDRAIVTLNTANMNNSETYAGWKSSGVKALVGAGVNQAYSDVLLNVGTTYFINTNGTNDLLMLPQNQYGKTQSEWIALGLDVQAIIELATPQTYQLTPQQIELLVGENHVWSDGAITMQYGDDPNSLWNPTRYDAGPIVSAEGYGVIRFNGYEIDLEDMSFGDIMLHNVYQSHNATQKLTVPFDRGFYRAGDLIKIYGLKIRSTVSPVSGRSFSRVTMQYNADSPSTAPTLTSGVSSDGSAYFQMAWNTVSFDVDSTSTLEYITDQSIDVFGESLTLTDAGRKQTITKTDDSIILDLTNFFTKGFSQFFSGHTYEISFERIVGHSTGTLIDGADFRIDCELGEAFMIKNGVLSNLNGYVDLGSDLPKLKSGNNPVEADSTITKLVITPNWWKL